MLLLAKSSLESRNQLAKSAARATLVVSNVARFSERHAVTSPGSTASANAARNPADRTHPKILYELLHARRAVALEQPSLSPAQREAGLGHLLVVLGPPRTVPPIDVHSPMSSTGSGDDVLDPPYRVDRYRQPVRLIIAAEADGPVYHFATPSAEMLFETHHDIHDDVVAGVISDSCSDDIDVTGSFIERGWPTLVHDLRISEGVSSILCARRPDIFKTISSEWQSALRQAIDLHTGLLCALESVDAPKHWQAALSAALQRREVDLLQAMERLDTDAVLRERVELARPLFASKPLTPESLNLLSLQVQLERDLMDRA